MIKWPWKTVNSASDTLPWQQALAIPLLGALSKAEQRALIQLARRFLQQKRLVELQGFVLDDLKSTRLALLFCLPVLNLGYEWLDGFHDVLIYPTPFMVDDEWQDEFGLVHHQRTAQAGQSWQQGPVVLNWLDVQDSFDLSGYNLVIHEVAHKLDARGSGHANGVPAIALRDIAGWEKDLHAAMSAIQEEVDLVGENAATIDAYAASSPAECFAVLSEYFFSAPDLLFERFPALYRRFTQFYRQDPAQRLPDEETQHNAGDIVD
ncbi:DgsA anti-repressor MtfA [Erwinia endophytica]|uniref:DgsA anti-repressor MtfA n=1 Tax=Erwinia endophytica TaxID=1563158 RepID=UPI001265D793|nr:DgsA anti-repressor MtfA [Erwinia endophytica]KAB8310709.1 DgsA anti-repressor MtfA [Erwinia endophytica]